MQSLSCARKQSTPVGAAKNCRFTLKLFGLVPKPSMRAGGMSLLSVGCLVQINAVQLVGDLAALSLFNAP